MSKDDENNVEDSLDVRSERSRGTAYAMASSVCAEMADIESSKVRFWGRCNSAEGTGSVRGGEDMGKGLGIDECRRCSGVVYMV